MAWGLSIVNKSLSAELNAQIRLNVRYKVLEQGIFTHGKRF